MEHAFARKSCCIVVNVIMSYGSVHVMLNIRITIFKKEFLEEYIPY